MVFVGKKLAKPWSYRFLIKNNYGTKILGHICVVLTALQNY